MIDRRNFLHMAMGAALTAHAQPVAAASSRSIRGANDRIRVGLIGCGSRGNQVATDWMKHKDSVFIAACDVDKDRLDKTAARLAGAQGNITRSLRGLPAHPRPQGRRRGAHRDAGSLARPDDH